MLYALLIVLIYLLIFKLFPDKGWVFPFVVALLFLIHPIHSEVVNNIKCRDELICYDLWVVWDIFIFEVCGFWIIRNLYHNCWGINDCSKYIVEKGRDLHLLSLYLWCYTISEM